MSRLGVTYEQVELAAEKLLAAGDNPTIERVRSVLGRTGSNSTISKYLNEWKSKRLRATAQDAPPQFVPPDPVNKAVNLVWQQIRDESQAEIQAIREQAQTEVMLAQEALTNAQQQQEGLQNELQQYQKMAALLESQNTELKNSFAQEKQQHELTKAHGEQAELFHQTLKQEMQQRISDLKTEQERHMILLKEQYLQKQENLLVTIKNLETTQAQRAQEFKVEEQALLKAKRDLEISHAQLQQEITQLQAHNLSAQQEKIHLEQQKNELTTAIAYEQQLYSQLEKKYSQISTELSLQTQFEPERQQRLEEQKQHIQHLQNTIEQLKYELNQKLASIMKEVL